MNQQFKNTKEPKVIQFPISLIHDIVRSVQNWRDVYIQYLQNIVRVLKLDNFRKQFKQLLKLGEWVTVQSYKLS